MVTACVVDLAGRQMYHEVSNGLRIVTVMSRGAAGELLLTFSFANRGASRGISRF
jgi:hypothetical protein